MSIGWPEIIILVVVVVVLFGLVKMFGDKRYFKRSSGSRASGEDKKGE